MTIYNYIRKTGMSATLIGLLTLPQLGYASPATSAAVETNPLRSRDPIVYEVKNGDYLGAIAIEHGTTVADIMSTNNLDNADRIQEGMQLSLPPKNGTSSTDAPQKRKKKKIIATVPQGFNLWKISQAYGVSIKAIVAANPNLANPDNIRVGQKLIIPGVDDEVELLPPPPCYAEAVEFYRVRTDTTEHIPLTFCNGTVNPKGIEALSLMSYPPHLEEMPFPLHPRLGVMLQKVADKFPGNRIEIISGQRVDKHNRKEAYHAKGQAIDFRVEGVSNKTLANFLRTFKNAGIGYYPNSVFVHLDTREQDAFWVDYSRPGERPIYARNGLSKKELQAIRAKRHRQRNQKTSNTTNIAQKSTSSTTDVATADKNGTVVSPATDTEADLDLDTIKQRIDDQLRNLKGTASRIDNNDADNIAASPLNPNAG